MSAHPESATRLRIDVLGPLQITIGGKEVTFRAPMHRSLLAILTIHANTVVSSEALIDELWEGAPPAGARATLQSYVSVVRKRCREAGLGNRSVIGTRQPGYVMHLQTDECDALELDELIRQARDLLVTGGSDGAQLHRAIDLFRGPILGDLDHLATVRAFGVDAQERHNWAVEQCAEVEIAAGNASDLVPRLRRLVDQQPLEERLWGLLMRALYHSGRQADALAAYNELGHHLAEELGVDPSAEVAAIQRQILGGSVRSGDDRSAGSPIRKPVRAPHTTATLFGRDGDLASLLEDLSRRRLVTIVGPGGCGKTRLAAEAARTLDHDFDEVAWVDLVTVDPEVDEVAAAVASGVGILQRPAQGLVELIISELTDRPVLLVFDNCEHVIDDAAEVVDTLQAACPGLTILATSREHLMLPGEHTVALYPLQSASPLALARATLDKPSDAAAMFLDRAGLGERGDERLPIVEAICAQLDGIPLAIELAASLASTMTLDDMADGLLDRFLLLADGMRGAAAHHRTLRSVVDWSHDLLERDERRAFMALSVFRGPFTLPAAQAVIEAVGGDARLLVPRLVRKSMVVADLGSSGAGRYHLLETLRAFGAEHLEADEGAERVRRAFVDHYLGVAHDWNRRKQSVAISAWLAELGDEIPNLQAALALARRIDENAAIRIVDSFRWYLNYLGPMIETRRWLAELIDASDLDLEQRAMVLISQAALANFGGDYAFTSTVAEDALAAARELGEPTRLNAALIMRGTTATFEGNAGRAAECFVESAELSEQLDDVGGIAASMVFWGVAYRRLGQFTDAQRCFDRAFDGFTRLADDRGLALVVGNLGRMAHQQGDLERADELTRRGLELAMRSLDPMVTAQCGLFCGHAQLDLGNTAQALDDFEVTLRWSLILGNRTMSSAALEWMVMLGGADPEHVAVIDAFTEPRRNAPGTASPRIEWDEAVAYARVALGADAHAALTARGAALTLDEAITYARAAACA